MELQAIRTFIDVVRHGSFAAAAGLRDIDLSSVSRTISSLETELGFPLLHRTTRRLALTEAGARYHARVEPMVDNLLKAAEEARDLVSTPAGTLRVTACTSFDVRVLAPLLPSFRISHEPTMTQCVLAGLAPALLPDWLCQAEIESGALIDLFPEHQCAATSFDTAAWLIYPHRHYRGLKVDGFVERLQKRLQRRSSEHHEIRE